MGNWLICPFRKNLALGVEAHQIGGEVPPLARRALFPGNQLVRWQDKRARRLNVPPGVGCIGGRMIDPERFAEQMQGNWWRLRHHVLAMEELRPERVEDRRAKRAAANLAEFHRGSRAPLAVYAALRAGLSVTCRPSNRAAPHLVRARIARLTKLTDGSIRLEPMGR